MPGDQVGSAYAKISLDSSALDSGLSSAKSKFSSAVGEMESMGSKVGSALKTGLAAAGVAAAGVATVGVKSFMDIESAAADAASKMDLAAIAQKSGTTTSAAFDSVKEHVMALSDELGQLNTNAFDPTEIATACAGLAAGGFDVASASAADLKDVLALATATNYDLADSAKLGMSTLNQFGMTVSDLGHVSDVYATAAGKSAAGMGDFDYAMQQAGPVAKGVGMSFEELTARVSKLADAGYSGEKSGTALRTAFMALTSPTKTQEETLAKLGLTFDDVNPRVHSFSETMDLLLSKGADIYDFGEIYGKEGAAIVYSTAQQNSAVKELTAELENCDGAAAEMAKNMLNTLSGSFDAAMGAASSLAYMIGGELAPTIRGALDWFSSAGAPAIRTFIEALSAGDFEAAGNQIGITVDKIKSAVAGLATAVGVTVFAAGLTSLVPVAASMAAGVIVSTASMVATTAGSIATMVASHVSGFASMVATSVTSWATMKALAISSWASQKAAALASMALTVEVTLAGYAKMATGALASVLTMASGVAASFGSMATNAALRLGTMTAATLGGYAKMATGALASVAAMVAGTLAGFASMVTGVVASVTGMAASLAAPLLLVTAGLAAIGLAADPSKFTTLGKIGSDALNGLKSVASDCWEAINKGDFGAVADRLKSAFSDSIDYIKKIDWSGVGSDIAKAVGVGWDTLKDYAAKAGEAAVSALKSAFEYASDIAAGLYEDFKNIDWGGVWDSLVSAWDSAIDALSDVGSTILGYFDDVDWGTVGFELGKAIRDAIEKLADIGSIVWNYLTSADWSGAGSSITEKIRAGLETLSDAWEDFKAGLLTVDWLGAAGEIADKLKAGFKQVTDWAADIIEGVKSDWDDWISSGGPKTLGEDLAKAVVEGARDLGKWIYDKIESYWDSIKTDGGSLGRTIWQTFKNIFNSVIDFASMALSAAWDFVKGFADTIIKTGKGTIGAAILDIVGDAMNSAWDGAGDSLKTKATEWRKDAETILSDINADVDVDTTWNGTDPSSVDKQTYNANVVVSVSGEDITEKVNAIAGSKGATGTKGISLRYKPSDSTYYMVTDPNKGEKTTTTEEWAYQMGLANADLATFSKKLQEAQNNAGFNLQPKDVEKFTAAFTKGQDEYKKTHKEAGEDFKEDVNEAGEGLKEDVKEAGETETDAADEAADTTVDAAETAAGITTGAAEQASATSLNAAAEAAGKTLNGSQTAANTLQNAAQVAANFTTQGGQSVKIGLDSAGREIAVIGSVAQQKITAAGGDLYSKVQVAGSGLKSDGITTGNSIKAGGTSAETSLKTGASAINSASSSLSSAATKLSASYSSGYGIIYNDGTKSGRITEGNSSSSTGHTATSSGKFDDPWMNAGKGVSPSGYAGGKETTGPEYALIGEDGKEYVIPTKRKRWDLLIAAMRSYGIKTFAEGGEAGAGGSSGAVDPDKMTAYFGLTGLASMSKQVKKILTDLKDFFRITWGIIRSEGLTYWKAINQSITVEVTAFRDSTWEALLGVRNTALQSFDQILESCKTSFSGMWPGIQSTIESLKSNVASNFSDMGNQVKSAIDQMVLNGESSMSAFSSSWSSVWSDMLEDLSAAQTKISAACSEIAKELSKINVNVNISSGGGSSGGGSGGSNAGEYGEWSPTDGGWLQGTGDMGSTYNVTNNGGSCAVGTGCSSGGCPDYMTAVIDSTGPLATAGLGVSGKKTSSGSYTNSAGTTFGSSAVASANPNFTLPSVWTSDLWRAEGALEDKGPRHVIVGEAGPELIIPAKYTRLMDWMADQVKGLSGGGGSGKFVIEDRTTHEHYWDGRRVTDLVMSRSKKNLQIKGIASVR